MRRLWSFLVVAIVLVAGCNINRDIMFKTPLDYPFDQVNDTLDRNFKIQANDVITFRLFANDGFRMIDLVDENNGALRSLARVVFNYGVDPDGRTKLPLLGMVKVTGLTVRQAEAMLEERYTEYYNKPFVLLTVSNRRVIVFPGEGGGAKVVGLENTNTTILEAIAQVGGVSKRGDARKVKVFRRKPGGGRYIYEFNMSDINGLKYGDFIVQANDVIYIQPNPQLATEILQNINPVITLLTTTVLVIGIVKGFSK